MKFLISLLAVGLLTPAISQANFSGFSMTESPVEAVEAIVDQTLAVTKLEERMSKDSKELIKLKAALINGALKDNEVLRNIVKIRNDSTAVKNLPLEDQEREYNYNQEYLKSTAQEFGYRDIIATQAP